MLPKNGAETAGAQSNSGPALQQNNLSGQWGGLPAPRKDIPAPEDRIPSIFTDGFLQFLIGVLLFVALLYKQTGLIILALLILGMVYGAKLWSRLSLAGLHCRYSADNEKVFPDEQIMFKAQVENHSFLPVWMEMEIKAPAGKTLEAVFAGNKGLSGESVLLWKQKISWQWALTARKRGCFPVGPAELAAGDLLGFFRQKKALPPAGEIVVFPKIIPLRAFPFHQEAFFGTQRAGGPVQDPVFPVATRDYHHGRPARHIHWKASARHNRLQEKIFEPTAHGKNLLVIDVKQFAENKASENFERTLEVAASLAVKMAQRGSAVGIASNGSLAGGGRAVLPPAPGPGQLSALLEVLGRLQMEYVGLIGDIFKLGRQLTGGIICTCFFLQVDAALLSVKETLRRHQIPAVFITGQASSGAGSSLPAAGGQIYFLHELCGEEGVPLG